MRGDMSESSSRGSQEPVPGSPPARRSGLPSWLDLRLAFGLLLVLLSVVVGARVIAAADRTVQVWSVTSNLAAGTTLSADDLAPVKVRLGTDADRYLAAGVSPTGRTLNRDLGSGELLPAAALGSAPTGQLVSLPVGSLHAPQNLARGQRVDVFATGSRASGGSGTTIRVLTAVTVQDVRRPTGGLSGAGDQLAVVVRVTTEDVASLVAAVNGATLDVTVVLDKEANQGTPRPVTVPGVVSASPTPTTSGRP